jgi:osmotically-inducible protein OsmY
MNHPRTHQGTVARLALATPAMILMLALTACKSAEPARKPVDDAAITAKIKAKLAADGDINPFNIDVTANEGVVTLQGRVKKEASKIKAERYASETDGVVRVINLVKVGDIR